jgi:cytochrome c-type biogenesis protein CcmH
MSANTLFYLIALVFTASVLTVLFYPLWASGDRRKRRFAVIGFLVLTIAPFVLYGWLGSPRILSMLDMRERYFAEIDSAVAKAQALTQSHPDSPKAWLALGEACIERERFADASEALRKAVLLSGGDPHALTLYGKSLVLQANGDVTQDAAKAFEMALLQDKTNPQAHFFLAIRKLQRHDTPGAKRDLQALVDDLPENAPLAAMARRKLEEISAAPDDNDQ